MSGLWLLAGIALTLVLLAIIGRCCWPERGHPPNCLCRVCREKWPRPGGTL